MTASKRRTEPGPGTLKPVLHQALEFERLPPHAVLSDGARELGWRLFGNQGPPVLTPTIERRFGGIRIMEHHLGPCVGRRLGDSKRGVFLATVYVIDGSAWGYGPRGGHLLGAGDIATWHSSQEITFEVERMVRKVVFFFDVENVGPLALDPVLCDQSIRGESPLGALLSPMFGELWRRLDSTPPEFQPAALAMAKDALTAALRATSRLGEQRPARTLFDRIAEHIEHSFGDPALSPASVAAALGISIRYLHLLFAQRGHTAAAWIRERRLAYCREALAKLDSELTVTEVAFKAGFTDSSHFSRVFRQRFGMAPNQYRHLQSGRASKA